jgi:hypothetical protein
MLVLSNNCCGGRLYQQTNTKFNNPFIWAVVPYDSIVYVMGNFYKIDWYDYELEKSKLRSNTFVIRVENKIEFHYVHYKFDPTAKSITQEKKFDKEEKWTGDVLYCRIWEFINQKYLERAKRMVECNDEPCFLIRDESYSNGNSKFSIKDIADNESNFKRLIITTNKTVNRNDDVCKTIHVGKIEMPLPTVIHNLPIITSFLI